MDPITQAAEDEAWLRERLGGRYRGTVLEPGGMWRATAERITGKWVWCWGRSKIEALAKLRRKVEGR